MSKQIDLSICIPTNNRSKFLNSNLKAIKRAIGKKMVEIVVADDASTDDTESVVKKFIKYNPKVKVVYKRFKKRIFFDRVVLEMVGLATGKFCWLLGDDDSPEPKSIQKIVSIINKYSSVSLIHLNYSRFDNILNKVTSKRMIYGINEDILFENYKDFYFKKINNSYFKFLGTHTITISSDVVNRKKWLAAAKKLNKYIGHNFIHSFVIGTIIKNRNSVYFVSEPQVQYLSNNHRVWPNDIWKDYNSVLLGYLQKIGFPKELIRIMRSQQKEYEKRESLIKNKFITFLSPVLRPIYSYYQKIVNMTSN